MDHRERVEAALAGGRPDRVPVGAWGHSYREEWSAEALAAFTVRRAREFDWDYVKFQPRASSFAEAFGNTYRPSNHPFKSGPILTAAVNDLEGWERLRLSNPEVLDEQVRSLALVVRQLGERTPVLQTVFSPISVAAYLVGKDKRRAVREMRAHPDLVLPALERVADALIDFAAASVAAGAAGLFYAVSGYATPKAMPAAVYREMLLPLDRRVVAAFPAQAWFNVLHLCGSHVTLDIAGDIGLPVLSWSVSNQGNPGLAEIQAATGLVVMGGIAHRSTLVRGPLALIRAEVAAAAAVNGGRRVIVAPGCSVPPRTPAANLLAMTEAA